MNGRTMRGDFGLVLLVVLGGVADIVTSQCPRKCSCKPPDNPTAVNCAFLKLDRFPENLSRTVKWLDLSENWIDSLPPSLTNYPQLRKLNMSGNRLSTISKTTFTGLNNLIHLDLSKNKITSFTDINGQFFLQASDNLKTLNLSYNQFQKFDSNETFNSASLEVLDLSNCKINFLDEGTLDGLPSLTHLNVSKNPLKWITEVHPLQANTLTHLDMSYCQLDSIRHNALEEMPNLHTLIVSKNKQLNLDTFSVLSTSLQHFEAEFCQFKRPVISGFQNLIYANLRGNNIDPLRAKQFLNNVKLKILDLSENHLTRIWGDAFLGLNDIESINLSRNDITEITWDMFLTNYELTHLNLSHNSLTSFPKNLTISHLTTLSLSMCNINNFDNASLTRLPYLSFLDLSQNLIKEVPNNIESNSLKHFDLSFGYLSSINNDTFAKLPVIEYLNLRSNRFTSIPKDYMFTSNPLLQAIELSDNPWICDCKDTDFKLFWIYLTNFPAKLEPKERKELKCTSPQQIAGMSWEDGCHKELYPSERSATFLDHYGVYLLIIAMTASFVLIISVTVRQRMLKREKIMRSRLAALRRPGPPRTTQVERELIEVRSWQAQLTDVVVEEEVRQERAVSQPPTYEEAILMPRTQETTASAGELQDLPPTPGDMAEEAAASSSRSRDDHDSVEDSASENDHDYDDVTLDDPERKTEQESLNPEEVRLMKQLRIQVWSREDLDTLPD